MNNIESTPLFDCPLHALLTDLGFSDGDGDFTFDDPANPRRVTIGTPTGYGFTIALPDAGLEQQLNVIVQTLDGFNPGAEDTAEQARLEGCDDPREWHDTLVATRAWCGLQATRCRNHGYALIRLLQLDPHAMSYEDFLLDMWSVMNINSNIIPFTLMDEHLKSIDHPAMRRPEEASR